MTKYGDILAHTKKKKKKKKILDIIDFRVIKSITKKNFSIKTSLDLSSDHSPIIININNEVIKKMQPCMLHYMGIN